MSKCYKADGQPCHQKGCSECRITELEAEVDRATEDLKAELDKTFHLEAEVERMKTVVDVIIIHYSRTMS